MEQCHMHSSRNYVHKLNRYKRDYFLDNIFSYVVDRE
jgi:hypothetical protein